MFLIEKSNISNQNAIQDVVFLPWFYLGLNWIGLNCLIVGPQNET
jgi:hypothetical protein